MHYEGNIIRPPSEANSILLQVTVGCSHNKCTFCGVYKGERFKIKDDSIIMQDIDYAAKYYKNFDRLFICDGDALIIPQKRLLKILKAIKNKLPNVKRIGIYANTKGINSKTLEELIALKKHGLGIAYMGLESGDSETLFKIKKGADSHKMIDMGKKLIQSGIKLSITVLLGIAGKDRSKIHAQETGKVLSAIDPQYVGALSLMLMPNAPIYEDYKAKRFLLPEPDEMLKELRTIIEHTHLSQGLFHANHASNYLPIKATLPKDKEATLHLIDQALDGKISLKPEYLRAL